MTKPRQRLHIEHSIKLLLNFSGYTLQKWPKVAHVKAIKATFGVKVKSAQNSKRDFPHISLGVVPSVSPTQFFNSASSFGNLPNRSRRLADFAWNMRSINYAPAPSRDSRPVVARLYPALQRATSEHPLYAARFCGKAVFLSSIKNLSPRPTVPHEFSYYPQKFAALSSLITN